MKKVIFVAILSIGLSFFGASSFALASESLDSVSNKNSVQQNTLVENKDSNNSIKQSLGVIEYPTPYLQITTYSNGSVTGIDFSEATFYDEKGNEIEAPIDSDSNLITPFISGSTGGSWNSGTGYNCVKGVEVYAGSLLDNVKLSFEADFCIIQGAYDEISRSYGEAIDAYDWSFLDTGVFRSIETLTYSAYSGIKAQVRYSKDGNLHTDYVYLRVGNDRYWVDSSF